MQARLPISHLPVSRGDCIDRDRVDPLADQRAAFALPDGVVYLDGNSLGALPRAAAVRVQEAVTDQWGRQLIRAWNTAGWIDAARRVGARIAGLIGAHPDEVVCADSTSLNVFKTLAAAVRLQARRGEQTAGAAVRRPVTIVSEQGNFPTDLYIAQGLVDLLGQQARLDVVATTELGAAIDRADVVLLTHVNYRTGAMHDMAALTRRAQAAGALVIWDLAHSAGAVPVDLNGCGADFAVGCGYKYLNGGPGAPAFVVVARRHLEILAGERFAQPLSGWLGHADPFEFSGDYRPAASIDRFTVGTPSILALAALEAGIETVASAGVGALRAKSLALSDLFIELVEARCPADAGLRVVTPRPHAERGSQICVAHPDAWPVMQALIAREVIGDFRAPDILRFGFAPLYNRFVDVWDAVDALREILVTGSWRRPEFQRRRTVT